MTKPRPCSAAGLRYPTIGGVRGQRFRRVIHLLMVVVPLVYYYLLSSLTVPMQLRLILAVFYIELLVLIIEGVRLAAGVLFFGQRAHERNQLSSFAASCTGLFLVLLFAPSPVIGVAIIASCAFADPFSGWLRARTRCVVRSILGTWLLVTLIWLICHWYGGLPLYLCAFLPPIIALAEQCQQHYVDDNFLMMILPLLLGNYLQ